MPDFLDEITILWNLAPEWFQVATKIFSVLLVAYLAKKRRISFEAKNESRIQSLVDSAVNEPLFFWLIAASSVFAFWCLMHAVYLDVTMYVSDAPFARLPK